MNLYFVNSSATVFRSSSVSDLDQMRVHEFSQGLLPVAEEEVTEGDDSQGLPSFVRDVDVGHGLQGMGRLLELLDGGPDRWSRPAGR